MISPGNDRRSFHSQNHAVSELFPAQLRILFLEDQPEYNKFLSALLLNNHVESVITHVDTRDTYFKTLTTSAFDAIISDYLLPDLNGKEALALAQQICPATPFIIFTGSVDDETAVECMKLGAADYVLKQQPARLVPALLSAVANARKEDERKNALEMLHRSEEHYRKLADNFPNGAITVYDRDLRLTFVAGQELTTSGKRADNFIGKTFQELAPPETFAIAESHLKGAFEGITGTYETPYWGNRFYRVTVAPLSKMGGEIDEILVISQDITEIKKTGEALGETEVRLRNFFQMPLIGMAITSPEKGWVEVNDRMCSILGYSREELFRMTWAEMTHPDDLAADTEQFDRMLAGKIDTYSMDKRFIRRNGEAIWTGISVGCTRALDGKVKAVMALALDISERKQSEEVLRRSERDYRQLFQDNPHPMWAYDPATLAFLAVNDAAIKHYGYSKDEFLTMTIKDIRPPEDIPALIKETEHLSAGLNETKVWRHRKKDGTIIYVEIRSHQTLFAGKQARIVLAHDITERKRAEEELTRSANQLRAFAAHLQSIREEERTLIAREIHDQLGQILTVLYFDLSILQELLQGKATASILSTMTKKVQGMSDLATEAIQLVRSISTHLRPVILDSLGLSAAIDWEVEEFRKRSGIQCTCLLPEIDVKIDRDRTTALFRILQEALTNVIRHGKATTVHVQLTSDTHSTVLQVEDNGIGISNEQIRSSTSLGILGMKERALVCGGAVDVSGSSGKGTTVTATIPLT